MPTVCVAEAFDDEMLEKMCALPAGVDRNEWLATHGLFTLYRLWSRFIRNPFFSVGALRSCKCAMRVDLGGVYVRFVHYNELPGYIVSAIE